MVEVGHIEKSIGTKVDSIGTREELALGEGLDFSRGSDLGKEVAAAVTNVEIVGGVNGDSYWASQPTVDEPGHFTGAADAVDGVALEVGLEEITSRVDRVAGRAVEAAGECLDAALGRDLPHFITEVRHAEEPQSIHGHPTESAAGIELLARLERAGAV